MSFQQYISSFPKVNFPLNLRQLVFVTQPPCNNNCQLYVDGSCPQCLRYLAIRNGQTLVLNHTSFMFDLLTEFRNSATVARQFHIRQRPPPRSPAMILPVPVFAYLNNAMTNPPCHHTTPTPSQNCTLCSRPEPTPAPGPTDTCRTCNRDPPHVRPNANQTCSLCSRRPPLSAPDSTSACDLCSRLDPMLLNICNHIVPSPEDTCDLCARPPPNTELSPPTDKETPCPLCSRVAAPEAPEHDDFCALCHRPSPIPVPQDDEVCQLCDREHMTRPESPNSPCQLCHRIENTAPVCTHVAPDDNEICQLCHRSARAPACPHRHIIAPLDPTPVYAFTNRETLTPAPNSNLSLSMVRSFISSCEAFARNEGNMLNADTYLNSYSSQQRNALTQTFSMLSRGPTRFLSHYVAAANDIASTYDDTLPE